MPANLCIQVTSSASADMQEVKFFHFDDWSSDSEEELLIRIRNILTIAANIAKSCRPSKDYFFRPG